MSWQEYIDKSLVGTGHIDKAAIVSKDGDSTWATSDGFTVTAEELKQIANLMADEGSSTGSYVKKAYSEGVYVAGERYVATNIEDRHVYARMGKTGVCIVKTTLAILIGHYDGNIQAGNAATTVEALADYMMARNC